MVSLLISLLILLIVCALIIWVVGEFLPEGRRFAVVICVVIVVIFLLLQIGNLGNLSVG